MILGGICTRSCQFCDVPTGRPLPPDPDEPEHVATMLAELGLRHTVITCVDRDDLPDGGAAHWAATIRAVKRAQPRAGAGGPDRRLQGRHRRRRHGARRRPRRLRAQPGDGAAPLAPGARAGQLRRAPTPSSRHAKQRGAITKTGLMLGLGEELDEVRAVLRELREHRRRHPDAGPVPAPVAQAPGRRPLRAARPSSPRSRPRRWRSGFPHVESGPMVRSSYHADGQRDIVLALRAKRALQR